MSIESRGSSQMFVLSLLLDCRLSEWVLTMSLVLWMAKVLLSSQFIVQVKGKPDREAVEREIKELLAQGYIETSSSPFAAPIFFVSKRDGTMRMVVDYRALNDMTLRNRISLPRIDDVIDQLHQSHVL